MASRGESERPARVLYFVPEFPAATDAILHSQVIGQARLLQRNGFECMIVGAEFGSGRLSQAESLQTLADLPRVEVYDVYPDKPSWRTGKKLVSDAAEACIGDVHDFRPDFIYTRSFRTYPVAEEMAAKTGATTVYDLRGLEGHEIVYKRRSRSLCVNSLVRMAVWWQIARPLRVCLKRAHRLVCVSNHLQRWIQQEIGRTEAKVVPSCVDVGRFTFLAEQRKAKRADLGWAKEDLVVVFCGGSARWHRIDDVLNIVAKAQKQLPNLKLLLVSRVGGELLHRAEKVGLAAGSVHACGVRHSEVPIWLSVADLGIILRQDVLLNRVASPVKIGEYLACKLPVACSAEIGDYSELIAQEKVGVVLEENNASAAKQIADFLRMHQGNETLRSRARELAERRLSWQSNLETYRELYAR